MASLPPSFLNVLEGRVEITAAQNRFAAEMRAGAEAKGILSIGWHGGQARKEVHWNKELGLWMCFDRVSNRYWSAFGVGDPATVRGTLTVAVEINSPFAGVDRRIAGAFARGPEGDVYLVHRGKVGGGREGIGKSRFFEWYPGAVAPAGDSDRTTDVIVIGALEQPSFQAKVAAFVTSVHHFKNRDAPKTQTSDRLRFRPEFDRLKIVAPREQIEAQCRHGVIVNALHKELTEKGYRVANTPHIDLYVSSRGTRVAAFEVKPTADTYSVYTAIGQLYFHGRERNAAKIAVLPSNCELSQLDVLKTLGIRVLLYSWAGQLPHFENVEEVMRGISRGST